MTHIDKRAEFLRLVNGLEGVVNEVFPDFDKQPPDVFAERMDVTIRAAVSMLAASCATFVCYYGPGQLNQLLDTVDTNLRELIRMNIQQKIAEHHANTTPAGETVH